jgi:hypothetical protein
MKVHLIDRNSGVLVFGIAPFKLGFGFARHQHFQGLSDDLYL